MRQMEGLPPDPSKTLTVGLQGVRRVSLRVLPTGAKSWIWRCQYKKKDCWITMAPYGQWNLSQIEAEAARLAGLLKRGEDPRLPEERPSTLPTLDEIWPSFKSSYFREFNLSEAYATSFEEQWNLHIQPKIGHLRLDRVNSARAGDILDPLLNRGCKTTFNHLRSHLSVLYKWCDIRYPDAMTKNWVSGRKHQATDVKERFLSDEELRAFGAAWIKSKSRLKYNVMFCLLTGSRAGIFHKWDPAWIQNGSLKIKKGTKWVKHARYILLPKQVQCLLPHLVTPETTDHIGNSVDSLISLAKIKGPVGTHIFRKTFTSHGVMLEIHPNIVDSLVNHKGSKLVQAYQQWETAKLLPFAEQIVDHLVELMGIDLN